MPRFPGFSAEQLEYFRKEGTRGGRTAAKNMTAAERAARAQKAGQASAAAKRTKPRKQKAGR